MQENETLKPYFAGEKIYGDDFSLDEIEAWYEDEKEGYANLGAKNAEAYQYVYHSLNVQHGYRQLPEKTFKNVLGFGSAYGDEFKPIAERIEQLTILDPSDAFVKQEVFGIPVTYVKPEIDGTLPFDDQTFDLVTSLGVLHHIPNVSHVVKEMYRCLQPGGYCLVREPIISMGDWRHPRQGLTKRERGIPLPLFRDIVQDSGFAVVSETLCMFPLIPKVWEIIGRPVYNSSMATWLDAGLSRLLAGNWQYHATSLLKKFRPTNVFYVLERRGR